MRLLLTVLCLLFFAGCTPAKSAADDRAVARSVILTVAHATLAADRLCAQYVRASKDKAVGDECVRGWTIADNALTAAESAVDTWDDVAQNQIACAVLDAVSALKRIVAALAAVKIAPPPVVVDALALSGGLSSICRSVK